VKGGARIVLVLVLVVLVLERGREVSETYGTYPAA
jgi:hypothetical protein